MILVTMDEDNCCFKHGLHEQLKYFNFRQKQKRFAFKLIGVSIFVDFLVS